MIALPLLEHACGAHAQVGIAFADKDYPARAAFGIVIKVLDEFSDQSRDSWRTATADSADAAPLLEAAVQKYQVCAACAFHAALPLCIEAGWQFVHTLVALKRLQSRARENLRHGRQICALLVPVLLERRGAIGRHAKAHSAELQLLGQCNALGIPKPLHTLKSPQR